jgi:hypothetical protein
MHIINIKKKIMPSYGKKQAPAGVDKSPMMVPPGVRKMVSRNGLVASTLEIKNCGTKGNPALLAQR